jgi:hypothetical protein
MLPTFYGYWNSISFIDNSPLTWESNLFSIPWETRSGLREFSRRIMWTHLSKVTCKNCLDLSDTWLDICFHFKLATKYETSLRNEYIFPVFTHTLKMIKICNQYYTINLKVLLNIAVRLRDNSGIELELQSYYYYNM